MHFNAVWKTNERSCAIFLYFGVLDPDLKRDQCQEQELSAPLRGQGRYKKSPQREQKVLAGFQGRGTVFLCHCSTAHIKKNAK